MTFTPGHSKCRAWRCTHNTFVDNSHAPEILQRSGNESDTNMSSYQAYDRLHFNSLLDNIRTKASLLAIADNLIIEAGTKMAGKEDKRFASQCVQRKLGLI